MFELEESNGARRQLAIDRGGEPGEGAPSAHGDAPDARSAPDARLVVVHWAPPALAQDDELRALLAARGAAFLPLRHPNLVSTLEVVAEPGRCHWVSEFVPGEPLSRLLLQTKRGRRALSTRQLLVILAGVARALEHAHGAVDAAGRPRPVVHRHLCPASVLVTYDGAVKLSGDIGAASPERAAGLADAEHLPYLAPECLSGGEGDPRSDVYALGAILREALASRPAHPYPPPRGAAALEAIDLAAAAPAASPPLAAVVRRALSPDPEGRHPSMRELREELEQLAQLDALKNEPKLLFAFMYNYFFEEYSALEALLEERSLSHALLAQRPLPASAPRSPSSLPPPSSRPAARSMSQTGIRPTLRALFERASRAIEGASAHDTGPSSSLRQSGLRRRPEPSASPPPPAPHTPSARPGALLPSGASAHSTASVQLDASVQLNASAASAASSHPAPSTHLAPSALPKPDLPHTAHLHSQPGAHAFAAAPSETPPLPQRFAGLPVPGRLLLLARERRLPRGSRLAVGAAALTALALAWSLPSARDTARLAPEASPPLALGAPTEPSPSLHAASASASVSAAAIGPFLPIPLGPIMTVEPSPAAAAPRTPNLLGSVRIEPEPVEPEPVEPERAARSARALLDGRPAPSRPRAIPAPSRPRDAELAASAPPPPSATRYVALSELDDPSEATGLDLRTLNERPPRAIDKQNPYSR